MRTTFLKTLVEEAHKNEDIFLITPDLGYAVLEPFAQEFPNRFINAGIAACFKRENSLRLQHNSLCNIPPV